MSIEQIASTLWRHRALFLISLFLCVGAVVAATLSLPKTYKATATLYVGINKEVDAALAFDTNLGEQLARTYTTLASNPNVADEVLDRLGDDTTRSELLRHVSFAPVERTQLLEISAEESSPAAAERLANTYATVFVERVNEKFRQGETQSEISVNEAAAAPLEPAKPNPPLYIGLGAMLSLLVAFGLVLLRSRLDDGIRVRPEEDHVLDHPVVARIPVMTSKHGEDSARVKDAFRLLRTNVDFASEDRTQVLLVTSPSPVEGKSTVSAQLAMAAMADGEKVVLVEADLRRPGLGHTIVGDGLQHTGAGLTNYLVGAVDIDRSVVSHPRWPALDVVRSGPLPPNPASLLRSGRLDELIDELRLRYDRIVIDTSPISVGADAAVMVSRVDGVLYVLDASSTKRSLAVAGLSQLETARARILGMVLNRVSGLTEDSYGYYQEEFHIEAAARPSEPSAEEAEAGRRRIGV